MDQSPARERSHEIVVDEHIHFHVGPGELPRRGSHYPASASMPESLARAGNAAAVNTIAAIMRVFIACLLSGYSERTFALCTVSGDMQPLFAIGQGSAAAVTYRENSRERTSK